MRTALIERTGALVAAYVARNAVPAAELPTLIVRIHTALAHLSVTAAVDGSSVVRPSPAEIATSLGQEYLVSFIDGRPYRSIKRHLAAHGLTPDRYRDRYGLPAEYPMVSPGYAAVRSRIAKQTQLGQKAL